MLQEKKLTKENIEVTLQTILDPEVEVDIWTMGLIYRVGIRGDTVDVDMTYTTPLCPFGPEIVGQVKAKILELGAKEVRVNVVFDPPWKPPAELKEILGME
ncbi:MAG: metal-sulfur cluster assembly factor [Patescibacteria group bacterium]